LSEEALQVSSIIVTHNSMPAFGGCLTALSKAVVGITHELIIVDNGSGDNSIETALKFFPNANIIRAGKNIGFARGCNLGAKEAKGEYLLFINPDVVIDKEAVNILLKTAKKNRSAGMLAGRLRFENGEFQPTCRNFPTIPNMLFSRGSFLKYLVSSKDYRHYLYTLPDFSETTPVPSVAATLILIDRERFRKIGSFDERYFLYMEDTDLSLRLDQAGFENLYVPQAGAIHLWGKGSKEGKYFRYTRHHYSIWQYFLKHYPNGFSILLLPVLLIINFLGILILPGQKKRP